MGQMANMQCCMQNRGTWSIGRSWLRVRQMPAGLKWGGLQERGEKEEKVDVNV